MSSGRPLREEYEDDFESSEAADGARESSDQHPSDESFFFEEEILESSSASSALQPLQSTAVSVDSPHQPAAASSSLVSHAQYSSSFEPVPASPSPDDPPRHFHPDCQHAQEQPAQVAHPVGIRCNTIDPTATVQTQNPTTI